MRLIPSVYRMFEGRVAAPFWRQLTHLYEGLEELRAWFRARRPSAKSAGLKDRFCARPFESFELQENGSVYLCCPTWLRWRAGNLYDTDNLLAGIVVLSLLGLAVSWLIGCAERLLLAWR